MKIQKWFYLISKNKIHHYISFFNVLQNLFFVRKCTHIFYKLQTNIPISSQVVLRRVGQHQVHPSEGAREGRHQQDALLQLPRDAEGGRGAEAWRSRDRTASRFNVRGQVADEGNHRRAVTIHKKNWMICSVVYSADKILNIFWT